MTAGGWFVMILSVGSVLILFLWCVWKVLTTPSEAEKIHGAAGLDTPDVKEHEG